jgi:hypothetical protein
VGERELAFGALGASSEHQQRRRSRVLNFKLSSIGGLGRPANMTEKTIDPDQHRGMAAQKATDLRRLLADVDAKEKALRLRQDELEAQLVAAPAENWPEAAEKARYLLNLFAASSTAHDPRRQRLIAAVLDDFERLARE